MGDTGGRDQIISEVFSNLNSSMILSKKHQMSPPKSASFCLSIVILGIYLKMFVCFFSPFLTLLGTDLLRKLKSWYSSLLKAGKSV